MFYKPGRTARVRVKKQKKENDHDDTNNIATIRREADLINADRRDLAFIEVGMLNDRTGHVIKTTLQCTQERSVIILKEWE